MIDPLRTVSFGGGDALQAIAEKLGLHTLPLHIHEIVLAFSLYHFIYTYLSPALSTRAFPSIYPKLSSQTKVNWNVHMVSLVQSIFICTTALWILFLDHDLSNLDTKGRLGGYSGVAGMTQAFAAGYFAWDAVISAMHMDVFGVGLLAHALAALVIVILGFVRSLHFLNLSRPPRCAADLYCKRPFANYYGIAFVLYELSTPFLDFHWLFDKCHMTGSRIQLYNGIMLVLVFFGCRLAWGSYLSIRIYQDIWLLQNSPLSKDTKFPLWMVYLYFGMNTTLTTLNVYWFGQMIQAIMKRFPQSKQRKAKLATE